PRAAGQRPAVGTPGGRKEAPRVVEVVQGQAQLLEVVGTLHTAGRLAHLLDGGEQEADEDGDDGDHHQQLDQRESRKALGIRHLTANSAHDDTCERENGGWSDGRPDGIPAYLYPSSRYVSRKK